MNMEGSQTPALRPMTQLEEDELLARLTSAIETYNQRPRMETYLNDDIFLYRRLRSRTKMRQIKAHVGLPNFDVDALMGQMLPNMNETYEKNRLPIEVRTVHTRGKLLLEKNDNYQAILNRFLQPLDSSSPAPSVPVKAAPRSFLSKLLSSEPARSVVSPYTTRVLKPFIWRDYSATPPRALLFRELVQKVRGSSAPRPPPQDVPPAYESRSIDYCYLDMCHLAPVNSLLSMFFWPKIDVSDSLQYPDFTVVALYGRLIIGAGLMTPDVKQNEAYISFLWVHPDWQRNGIATFMLYHLIQTCMGKDVTLHVSASNPAMVLYQKFGFNVEELQLDFYKKYFPTSVKQSRNAFFLRLKR